MTKLLKHKSSTRVERQPLAFISSNFEQNRCNIPPAQVQCGRYVDVLLEATAPAALADLEDHAKEMVVLAAFNSLKLVPRWSATLKGHVQRGCVALRDRYAQPTVKYTASL